MNKRDFLYGKIIELWNKLPTINDRLNIKTLMKDRYGIDDTRRMSLEQIQDLVLCLELYVNK